MAGAGWSRAKGSASLRVVYRILESLQELQLCPSGASDITPARPRPNSLASSEHSELHRRRQICGNVPPPSLLGRSIQAEERDFWVNRALRCFTVKLRLSAGAALKSCPGARDQPPGRGCRTRRPRPGSFLGTFSAVGHRADRLQVALGGTAR